VTVTVVALQKLMKDRLLKMNMQHSKRFKHLIITKMNMMTMSWYYVSPGSLAILTIACRPQGTF
jgi:hypothetical protein